MLDGKVRWFNDQKGYGFIEAGGKDYFVHFKEVHKEGYKTLKEGDMVTFTPEISPKGLTAKAVQVR